MKQVKNYRRKMNPYFYIILSFLVVILLGTVLLLLPISTTSGNNLNFIEALFMTTSSVCVTGLSVLGNLSVELSIFGKCVIVVLMEIGGLSFLTIAFFFYSLIGQRLRLSTNFVLKEALNLSNFAMIKPLIKKIILVSLIIQLAGTISYLFVFVPFYKGDFWTALGVSVFQAVSSYCNAGLDIIGTSSSCIILANNPLFNITTMALIVFGGLGFAVILEIITKHRFKVFNLHTKIVLVMTLFLLVVPSICFKLMDPDLSVWQAMFLSTTARTAGFTTVDLNTLSNASVILLNVLMFIGASPCSTGGGVKTTTLFLVLISIGSFMRGKTATAFKRRISRDSILNAYVLISFSVMYIAGITLLMSLFDSGFSTKEILFESVSAFATVGLSLGITPQLSVYSKLILCLTMFIGRVGPLTVTSLWNRNWTKIRKEDIQYVTEDVIVG